MEVTAANGKKADKEIEHLKKKMEELRVGFTTQKKEVEDKY